MMMTQIAFRRPATLVGAALVALALLLPLAPARAATVGYSLTLPTAATANPVATSTSGASVNLIENVSGDFGANGRSPWDALNSTLDFNDPGALFSSVRNGTATYDFGGVFRQLSLVWGTRGPLNTLKLFLNGNETFSMTGSGPAAFSTNVNNSVLVTISDLQFDTMVVGAGNPAFEFANVTVAPIPLPAAGLLLVGALGGLAALRRRKAA
jgi:hypothetical protein